MDPGLAEHVLSVLRLASSNAQFDLERDQLVIGVSGGPDSLALLHVLQSHIPADRLIVAHLDHGLRPSSAAEAQQVALAARGSRFHTERIDVAIHARENGQSLEEAGRIARYELLTEVARKEGAAHIAVGHNQGDQVETILMHILRGSGLGGLRGMQPASPLPGHTGLWLLRPLLSVTREEIEAYCAENHLAPILDESNTSHSFLRNRIRGELLPLLETYNPQVRQRVIEMGEIITAEEEYLTSQATIEWDKLVIDQGPTHVILNRAGWLALPLTLRRRLLRLAVAAIPPGARDAGFRTIESARAVAEYGETGSRVDLPGDVAVLVSYDQLIIKNETVNLTRGFPQLLSIEPLPLSIPGKIELADGWQLTAEWLNSDEFDLDKIHANRDTWQAYAALNATDSLTVRPRLAGERMRPLGLNGERKLKEIMIDRKIPTHLRERWPVVATQDHTVWIVGHVMDERVRVISGAQRIVRLRCLSPGHHEAS